ncbi:MAG: AraC family transcriptional regulator [Thermoanaerobaculia bacterium]
MVTSGGVLSSGAYFGEAITQRSRAGLTLTETRYRAGEDLPAHAHERAFVSLLVAGGYSERYRPTQTVDYEPWSAVYHPAGEVHVTRMTRAGGRVANIELDPVWLERMEGFAPAPHTAPDRQAGALVWAAARLRRTLTSSIASQGEAVEALGYELLGALAGSFAMQGKPPRWLARVLDRLHDELPNVPGTEALAKEAGVHPVHLARVFRRFQGTSMAESVRRLRIQRACRLLGTPGPGLAMVASLTGFADQSHFTRAFRAVTGTTPAAFRRSLAG